jgi:hypothetical protein
MANQLALSAPLDPCQIVVQAAIGAVGGWAGWRLGLGYKNSPILGPTGALGYLYNINPAIAAARTWTVGQATGYGQFFGAVAAGGTTVAGWNTPHPTVFGGMNNSIGGRCGCRF